MTWTVGRGPRCGVYTGGPAAPGSGTTPEPSIGPYGNGTVSPYPAQSASVSYGTPTNSITGQYARPGGFILARKQDMGNQIFKNVSAGGGTVMGYIDALIHRTDDYYANMLFTANSKGPAVGLWPGRTANANQWGPLSSFGPSSPMHQASSNNPAWTKWEAVLEQMITDHPHLGGFFLDDTGTRSNYAGAPWSGFTTAERQSYRDGAILLVQAARRVADRHKMMIMVNGTWEGGTLAVHGGGYPNIGTHGCSLAEGMMWEGHDPDAFGETMLASTQWASDTPTQGARFHLITAETSAGRASWKTKNVAFVSDQMAGDPYNEVAPWGAGRANGLPNKAA